MNRPLVKTSIIKPISIHLPRTRTTREKILAWSYIELPLLLKQTRELHMYAHITGILVIKNGQLEVHVEGNI